ncbi:hypothetical protein A7D27_09820 [Pseudomonas sp. 1D4]|uniref:hypothetical protein n=1 Tax=Pseudomonas sp. 1D4 TaxID=1843691 RepID=UPI00084B9133|nr:hypothetical protein [Pseudomonas sp. 1D4]OEC43427.1 hypothetical protein A7D27_09820 [Pseudomonas sp. 1D4]
MHLQIDQRLRLYQAAFHYPAHIYGDPERWRREQLQAADELLRDGVIEAPEYLDMRDEVLAVHTHAVERTAGDALEMAGVYAVLDASNGGPVGRLERRFLSAGTRPELNHLTALHDANGQLQLMRDRRDPVGPVYGLEFHHQNGSRYQFRPLGFFHLGRIVPLITDPDHHQVVAALLLAAIEAGDQLQVELYRKRLRWSEFRTCPACSGRFSLREDCPNCNGIGLTERSLPPSWKAPPCSTPQGPIQPLLLPSPK